MAKRFQLIALLVGVFLLSPFHGEAGAFEGGVNPLLFNSLDNPANFPKKPDSFVSSLSKSYDQAFRRKIENRQAVFSLYYQEQNSVMGVAPDMLTDAERESEARVFARQALSSVLKETVRRVNVVHNMKEYGRSVTTAELKVQNGEVGFEGPSLDRAGRVEEPGRDETLRSSFVLINNIDFGLSLRTVILGSIRSNVTYFLAGRDVLGASLTKDLSRHADFKLEYRIAADENRALATVTLPFGY